MEVEAEVEAEVRNANGIDDVIGKAGRWLVTERHAASYCLFLG